MEPPATGPPAGPPSYPDPKITELFSGASAIQRWWAVGRAGDLPVAVSWGFALRWAGLSAHLMGAGRSAGPGMAKSALDLEITG